MNPISAIRPFVPSELQQMPGVPGALVTNPLKEMSDVVPMFTPQPTQGTTPVSGTFGDMLSRFVGEVNARQDAASSSVNGLISGQQVPLHQAMIAMEEASVSFQLMVEVRNKLLESYQELMRMQI